MATNQACFPLTIANNGEPVMNQITRVRMADGREIAIVDWSWKPVYSTIATLSGWTDSELRAFTYSLGDPVASTANIPVRPVANLKHCNNSNAGEMDATEEMLVYALATEIYENPDADLDGVPDYPVCRAQNLAYFNWKLILELDVSQKAYFQASVGWFPPGFGVNGVGTVSAAAAGANITLGNQGHPSREAIDMSPVPVHIGGTEKFAAILHNPDGDAIIYRDDAGAEDPEMSIPFRINLVGLLKRSAA